MYLSKITLFFHYNVQLGILAFQKLYLECNSDFILTLCPIYTDNVSQNMECYLFKMFHLGIRY